MTNEYLAHVGAVAARRLQERADARAREKDIVLTEAISTGNVKCVNVAPERSRRIAPRIPTQQIATSFPNNLGGYRRAEPKRPMLTPTPRQLFHSLAACYLAHSRPAFVQKPNFQMPRRFFFRDRSKRDGGFLIGFGPTRSEARANLKDDYALKTTRGIVALRPLRKAAA